MLSSRLISTVDSHTAGECTRLVTGGLPPILGATLADKLAYARSELSWLPKFLLLEPRGHKDMFGALLVPPCSPEASFGVLYMDNQDYEPMCGHATIGAVTTLLETGMLPITGDETEVVLETPSGLIRTFADTRDRRVNGVSFDNVPSFVFRPDLSLEVEGVGTLLSDIVFGGLFFVFVHASQLGLALVPGNASKLADLGMRILAAANRAVAVRHPKLPHLDRVIDIRFYHELPGPGLASRNVVILGDRMVDRSPCGTGTSAETALRFARGELEIGESFITESIIGTRFHTRPVRETRVGEFPAVIPRVTGRAFLTGLHQFTLGPADPFPQGFMLG